MHHLCREQVSRMCLDSYICIARLLPKFRKLWEREHTKTLRARGWGRRVKPCLLDMTESQHSWILSRYVWVHKTCTASVQLALQHRCRRGMEDYTTNWGATDNWWVLVKGKFSLGISSLIGWLCFSGYLWAAQTGLCELLKKIRT